MRLCEFGKGLTGGNISGVGPLPWQKELRELQDARRLEYGVQLRLECLLCILMRAAGLLHSARARDLLGRVSLEFSDGRADGLDEGARGGVLREIVEVRLPEAV